MSVEDIKKLARRFNEAFNRHETGIVDELLAEDFIEHELAPEMGFPEGREGVRAWLEAIYAAFPDIKSEMLGLVAEGDIVATHQMWRGTHKGEFLGIPATGKTVEFGGADFVRFRDGKAVEHWGYTDNLAIMQQLGVVPEGPLPG